jgi:hypothetical protein
MAIIDSLVSYWKLDETSGNAIDAHGSNDGTVTGASYEQTGILGTAFGFGRDGDRCEFNGAGGIDFGTVHSLSLWINTTTFDSTSQVVMGHDNFDDGGYFLVLDEASKQMLYDADGIFAVVTGHGMNTGTLYHVVVTRSGTSVKFYVNASQVGSTQTLSTNRAIQLSTFGAYRGGNSPFGGVLDEIGIWTKELSQGEITSLYNAGAGLAYPFSAGAVIQLQVSDDWKNYVGMQIVIDDGGKTWKGVEGLQINKADSWETIF